MTNGSSQFLVAPTTLNIFPPPQHIPSPEHLMRVPGVLPFATNIDIPSSSQSLEEFRTFDWIQSVNEEEFELMKNISYLEQFFDMHEDLDAEELARLDLAEFIGYFEPNPNNDDEYSQADSMHSNHSADGECEEGDNEEQLVDDDFIDNDIFEVNQIATAITPSNGDDGVEVNLNAIPVSSSQLAVVTGGKQEAKKSNRRSCLSSSSMDSGKDEGGEGRFGGVGTKKFHSSLSMLAQDQFIRISKYGDIALNANIARKNPKSNDFYDQEDSFIDDDQVDTELKQLAICNADYDDFFMIDGGLEELVKCVEFKQRLLNIQEYRDTKKLETHLNEQEPKKKQQKKQQQLSSKEGVECVATNEVQNKNSKKKQQQIAPAASLLFVDDEEEKGKRGYNRKQKKAQKNSTEDSNSNSPMMNGTAAALKVLSKQPAIAKQFSYRSGGAGAMVPIHEETMSGNSKMIPEFSNDSLVFQGIESRDSRNSTGFVTQSHEVGKVLKKQTKKQKKSISEFPAISVLSPIAKIEQTNAETPVIVSNIRQAKQTERRSAPVGGIAAVPAAAVTGGKKKQQQILEFENGKANPVPADLTHRMSETLLRVSINLTSKKKKDSIQQSAANQQSDGKGTINTTIDTPSLVKPIIRRSGSSARRAAAAAANKEVELLPNIASPAPTKVTATVAAVSAQSSSNQQGRSKSVSSSNDKKKGKQEAVRSSPISKDLITFVSTSTQKNPRSISQISNNKVFLEDSLPEMPKRKIVKSKKNSVHAVGNLLESIPNEEQSREFSKKSSRSRNSAESNKDKDEIKKSPNNKKKTAGNQKRKREIHIEEERTILSEKSDRRRK